MSVSQLLLPATAGSSFQRSSNDRFARFNRNEDRGLALPSGPIIHLPPPSAAGLLMAPPAPTPPVVLFQYDNLRWQRVAPAVRREGLLAVETLMDQMAAFFVGEMTETDFDQAVRAFRSKMFKASPTPMMAPAPAPRPKKQQQTPAGVKLGKLLRAWLDVEAHPAREVYEAEPWRYQLYCWHDHDGILIQRRAPDGRQYITGKVASSRLEAQAVIADLEREVAQRVARPITRRLAADVDGKRVEAVLEPSTSPSAAEVRAQERIAQLNADLVERTRKKLSYVQ